jgi:hypothetical protein
VRPGRARPLVFVTAMFGARSARAYINFNLDTCTSQLHSRNPNTIRSDNCAK